MKTTALKPIVITLNIHEVSLSSAMAEINPNDLILLQIEQKGILLTPKKYKKITKKLEEIRNIISPSPKASEKEFEDVLQRILSGFQRFRIE